MDSLSAKEPPEGDMTMINTKQPLIKNYTLKQGCTEQFGALKLHS